MAASLRAYIKLVFVTELSYFQASVFLITAPPSPLYYFYRLRCDMPCFPLEFFTPKCQIHPKTPLSTSAGWKVVSFKKKTSPAREHLLTGAKCP